MHIALTVAALGKPVMLECIEHAVVGMGGVEYLKSQPLAMTKPPGAPELAAGVDTGRKLALWRIVEHYSRLLVLVYRRQQYYPAARLF